MNAFNRAFIALLALAWVAALGAAVWLIWDQARVLTIDSETIALNFDIIANTRAEQLLATIIAGALMLPALFLLALELKPTRRRDLVTATADEGDVRKMQARIDSLERDLAAERARSEEVRIRQAEDGRPRPAATRRWHLFSRR